MRKTNLVMLSVLILFLSQLSGGVAKAADGRCPFGYDPTKLMIDDDFDPENCIKTKWEYNEVDDGFSKYFSIKIEPAYVPGFEVSFSGIEIFCDKKKIEVYIWVPYARSIGWSGVGQVTFDGGSPKKVDYLVTKTFDGIALKNPKTFMSSVVKAREKFAFKIPTVEGYEIVIYPKSNLLEYRSIFARAGCKF